MFGSDDESAESAVKMPIPITNERLAVILASLEKIYGVQGVVIALVPHPNGQYAPMALASTNVDLVHVMREIVAMHDRGAAVPVVVDMTDAQAAVDVAIEKKRREIASIVSPFQDAFDALDVDDEEPN